MKSANVTQHGSTYGRARVSSGPVDTGGVKLPVVWSLVLLASAAWNLLIWPRFWQRIAADPRSRDESGRATRFLTVHSVLIGVSLAFAVALGVLGVLTL